MNSVPFLHLAWKGSHFTFDLSCWWKLLTKIQWNSRMLVYYIGLANQAKKWCQSQALNNYDQSLHYIWLFDGHLFHQLYRLLHFSYFDTFVLTDDVSNVSFNYLRLEHVSTGMMFIGTGSEWCRIAAWLYEIACKVRRCSEAISDWTNTNFLIHV